MFMLLLKTKYFLVLGGAMQLLVRPKPYSDESLESYLLRLSQDNGFEYYQILSGSIKEHLYQYDHQAASVFPLELEKVNVYHANISSALRLRALCLIEELTSQAPATVLQLALMHSSMTFGPGYKSVHRSGTDLPLCFLRPNVIPCCPECLSESAYIRHYWHYMPYIACHTHGRKLLFHCPHCGAALNYMKNESLTHCSCSFDLRFATTEPSSKNEEMVSGSVSGMNSDGSNPLFVSDNLSMRYGALLWYCLRNEIDHGENAACSKFSLAYEYFNNWPNNFYEELQKLTSDAMLRQTNRLNYMSLNDIYKSTLINCRQLPFRDIEQNFVLDALLSFFIDLIRDNPKRHIPNIADLRLSVKDAACLLSTTVSHIFRLIDDGYLPLAIKPSRMREITHFLPILRLRQIIEFRLAYKPRSDFRKQNYVSRR
ncbi:TniQ family protein [Klebsiella oxytoca]|uniref:TniQ family protein n=1 Tax=Klebsiella oxytoca TaxID=571 RepID=UPI0035711599